MFPNHPNLLPAYFEDDPNAAKLGMSFVRKPLYSREGANVALVSAGTTLVEQEGPYGAEGFIRQALSPLPNFSDQYAVLGTWLVDHTPCGLSIREDEQFQHKLRAKIKTKRGRASLRKRTAVEHTISHHLAHQGRRARYKGLRKNQFDGRRHAAVSNLQVAAYYVEERQLAS